MAAGSPVPPLPEAELREALAGADLRALLLTVYQLTGDSRWQRLRPTRDTRILAPEDAGLAPEEQHELREAAFELLRSGAAMAEATIPDDAEMSALMDLCLGEAVPREYAPMMREELGFSARSVDWSIPSEDSAKAKASGQASPRSVLIVGAGVNGLALGNSLKQLGIPFQIIEKNPDIGGTWYENRYPGCGVDTPNHAYSFSFTRPFPWRSYFSGRDQIFDYLKRCADEFGIREYIQFNTRVERCDWQESTSEWAVTVLGPEGSQTLRGAYLVSAIGQFNEPHTPSLPGLDDFAGPVFHSSRWPDGLDLTGKRVAIVGTGASSMQIVSALAAEGNAESPALTVYQRTPQWARPIPRARESISPAAQWLMEQVPLYARWFRFLMFWRYGDGLLPFLKFDPDWQQPERSLNRVNEKHRQEMERYIATELEGQPELIEACTPSYPPYAKRMLIDFGWYRALRQPQVELVPQAVTAITRTGVVADGEERPADVLVLATGFDMTSMAARLNITGRAQASLAERWAPDNPSAYLGLQVPDFPNFSTMLGPNSGLGHGGSAMFIAECQARYISELLVGLHEQGLASATVTATAHDAFVEAVDREHETLIWAHPGMETYYRNSGGRVFSVLPWRLVDYWQMTRAVDWADFTLQRAD